MKQEELTRILIAPHVSEKSTQLAEKDRRYVFRVVPDATKKSVKAAVEKFFDVKVKSVGILNVKGKRKRFKSSLGRRSNWRKVYVTLQEGHEIELMGAE